MSLFICPFKEVKSKVLIENYSPITHQPHMIETLFGEMIETVISSMQILWPTYFSDSEKSFLIDSLFLTRKLPSLNTLNTFSASILLIDP